MKWKLREKCVEAVWDPGSSDDDFNSVSSAKYQFLTVWMLFQFSLELLPIASLLSFHLMLVLRNRLSMQHSVLLRLLSAMDYKGNISSICWFPYMSSKARLHCFSLWFAKMQFRFAFSTCWGFFCMKLFWESMQSYPLVLEGFVSWDNQVQVQCPFWFAALLEEWT